MMIAVVVFILALQSAAHADLFTSVAEMELLLEAEKGIPDLLDMYIERFQLRLNEIKQLSMGKKHRNDHSLGNDMRVLSNPISAYLLIKRLIEEWNNIKRLAGSDIGEELLKEISELRAVNYVKNPTMEDLDGAAIALLRLQDTYRLNVKEIADGKILNASVVQPFTARDCFDIGRAAYNVNDYYHTVIWMEEAQERLRTEMPHETVQLKEILEYLAFALFKQGNLKRALLLTEQLYTIDPNHPRARNNIKWYEDLLAEDGVKPIDYRRNIPPVTNPRPKNGLKTTEHDMYEALCRNEVPVSVKATSKLYCYYKMDRPFLRLAPFKVEILRFSPLAVFFRDVITDEEVTIIQMLATPRLRRATVQNSITGELETASYRTSKSAWLKDEEHEIVHRINRRIDLMTNLEQETSEELQVGNYGIGGHYDPHFDFARREEVNAFQSLNTGNRLATLLFYMTQPESGGATVFTEVKTTVMPSKNDALFWYNLLRSGEGDLRTRHAACPVLIGSKWVSNKWIHERGQEFRRPCGLSRSVEERFVGDLGA
ncbi:prolyl 4-hydroxylase 2 [Loa loa]|uniref:procollagen-proline 4-dioxygenase n=2 Tax=Loa loa TaxID=7209 RepID=A0A1S0TX51_LOALO|nr:prolyl 4-hydroxylase 2 [Loa loa]EFO21561.2 prolyl 4-hydroxylase 2 [Loa loa]